MECYKGYFKIVQQMKESNFKVKFNLIFKVAWQLVLKAQNQIQNHKTLESLNDSRVDLDDIQL